MLLQSAAVADTTWNVELLLFAEASRSSGCSDHLRERLKPRRTQITPFFDSVAVPVRKSGTRVRKIQSEFHIKIIVYICKYELCHEFFSFA